MKIRIGETELFPVWYLKGESANSGYPVEIDQKTLNRWEQVWKEWEEVQREMRKAVGEED